MTRVSASQSFTAREVEALYLLFSTAMRGGDMSVIVTQPNAQAAFRKVARMAERIRDLQAVRDDSNAATCIRSSCSCTRSERATRVNPMGHARDCALFGTVWGARAGEEVRRRRRRLVRR